MAPQTNFRRTGQTSHGQARRICRRLLAAACRAILVGLFLAVIAHAGAANAAAPLDVWAVDPHAKIFRDAKPSQAPGTVTLRAARNEYEPGQFVVRSVQPLRQARVELSPLRHTAASATIPPENVSWNFVGYIPLKKNTRGSAAIQVRAAPCEIPDPLVDLRALDLPADVAQPVWLTVRVPKDATPGVYRGEATVVAGEARATVPIELTVDAFTLPDERHLLVTNWFNLGNIAKAHKAELWSEPFWTVLESYARNMAAHRQNVALVPWNLVDVTRETDGKLSFNYARFDRYVELFQRAGVADGIEIGHVGHGKKGWGSEFVLASVGITDRATEKRSTLGAEEGLRPLLADLQRHLDQRGWLAKAMIHVADEPIIENLASWRRAADFVRQAAPRLRRIEAIETIDCTGALEVWVPQISHFDRWRQAYEARRGDGEFWYYICCNPYGSVYPNRFLDFPSGQVRVLHWINFSERLAGYLHWGLNFWGAEPFGTPGDRLPPGDTHVVYPGSKGPLDSIRWEIQRESIEDFEYLCLLASKTEECRKRLGKPATWLDSRRRAEELCRRVVPAIADCQTDPARILAARQAVAEEILALDQPPLLLVQTEPPDGTTVVEGPIAIEVRGLVEPGATVKVNGRAIAVSENGTFACRSGPQVRIEAEREGKKKTTVRSFPVRKEP